MNVPGFLLAIFLSLWAFSPVGQSHEIEISAADPTFQSRGVLSRKVKVVYRNPLLKEGSQVSVHYGFQTRVHGSTNNPVTGVKPEGGVSQYCHVIFLKDWQKNDLVELSAGSEGEFSTTLLVNQGERTSGVLVSQLQFYFSIVDQAGQNMLDRPGAEGYFLTTVDWPIDTVTREGEPTNWTRLPLMAKP